MYYQTGARNAYVCDRQIQQAYIKLGLEMPMPKKNFLKKTYYHSKTCLSSGVRHWIYQPLLFYVFSIIEHRIYTNCSRMQLI